MPNGEVDGEQKKEPFWEDRNGDVRGGRIAAAIVLAIILIIGTCMVVFPIYGVWAQGLSGKADLREAEWNRQIMIKEAEANLEAEALNALAEVERAKGLAESQKIVAETLTEEYLKYLWIDGLHDGSSEVIYVATEANLPILEAGRNLK